MNTMRSTWPSAVAGFVLIGGGGLLMNYGTEAPSVGTKAASANQAVVMVDKLNQFIAHIGGASAEQSNSSGNTTNSSTTRFVIAFPGAVLDKQTGLVWEEVPDATPRSWTDAIRYCVNKTVCGTIGWRLPSTEELKNVQDPSTAPPFVPAGSFMSVQPTTYWSASKASISLSFVHLVDDRVSGGNTPNMFPAWCVRGGVNSEQY